MQDFKQFLDVNVQVKTRWTKN